VQSAIGLVTNGLPTIARHFLNLAKVDHGRQDGAQSFEDGRDGGRVQIVHVRKSDQECHEQNAKDYQVGFQASDCSVDFR
jgi:hypothetical protein